MRKIGLVEMPMGILRMKKSAHPDKMHCHSHKRYQLLLIRPRLRKGRRERWVHKTWMRWKVHKLQEKEMFRLRVMGARRPDNLLLPTGTL
jgi:hypothetical protein